ncbi:hypothetical protein K488DRAFT_73292 [Vararia minispora EC-137]|uniref:Uncharacterized protein n=1 Tax=Vararia minispora EC-137 TaxID=1314806 RepID=A0ACB8QCP1_9AGAM|nr:hypothetical protein K488DRAFT_73292 [Vararia minispora EC-137]
MSNQNTSTKPEIIHAKKPPTYLSINMLLCAEVAALRVLLCVEFNAGPEEVKTLLVKYEMDMESRLEDVERALRRFGLYGRLGTGKTRANREVMEDDSIDAEVGAALRAYSLVQKERMGGKLENIVELDDEDEDAEDSDAYH